MVQRSLHIFSKGALCKGPLQADLEDLVSHKASICSPYRDEYQPTFFVYKYMRVILFRSDMLHMLSEEISSTMRGGL